MDVSFASHLFSGVDLNDIIFFPSTYIVTIFVLIITNQTHMSVGALEEQGLRWTLGEDVFKMSSGSLVVLKGIDAIT